MSLRSELLCSIANLSMGVLRVQGTATVHHFGFAPALFSVPELNATLEDMAKTLERYGEICILRFRKEGGELFLGRIYAAGQVICLYPSILIADDLARKRGGVPQLSIPVDPLWST